MVSKSLPSSLDIKWARLDHCPDDQLVKAGADSDAGFDIRCAQTVIVRSYESLESLGLFTWEVVSPITTDLPLELKTRSIFNRGFKLQTFVAVYSTNLPDYVSRSCYEDGKLFGELGNLYALLKDPVVGYVDANIASWLGGVEHKEIDFLMRKKYKPTMIPTGIVLTPQSLAWCNVVLRSSMIKYGIGIPHAFGTIDMSYLGEIFIPLHAYHQDVPFMKGERVAQLIPTVLAKANLELVSMDEIMKGEDRGGGFGSTGVN